MVISKCLKASAADNVNPRISHGGHLLLVARVNGEAHNYVTARGVLTWLGWDTRLIGRNNITSPANRFDIPSASDDEQRP